MDKLAKVPRGQAGMVIEAVLAHPDYRFTPERIKDIRPSITLSHETIGRTLRRGYVSGILDKEEYTGANGQRIVEYFRRRNEAQD